MSKKRHDRKSAVREKEEKKGTKNEKIVQFEEEKRESWTFLFFFIRI